MIRTVIWLVLGISGLLGGVWLATRPPRGLPVDVATVNHHTIEEYVEEEGKTRLPDVVRITMPMTGRVLPITLQEGDRVADGDVVARVDPCDLETELVERQNSVRQYDKNLEQIDLTIEQARQTVLASQAKLEFSQKLFQRAKQMAVQNSLNQSRLDEEELRATEAALGLKKEQLNQSVYEIMRSVIELMRDSDQAKFARAQRERARAEIVTPAAGVVLRKTESNERVMAAGEVLLEIGDIQQLEMEADVLTQDVTRVAVGDRVEVSGAELGTETVQGRVARIYPQGFTKISSLGVEQQRVTVVMAFEPGVVERLQNAGRMLGVDYRVRVRIFTGQAPDALVIPRAALFRSAAGKWQTFVVRDGRAVLTDLELGLQNDFEVQVVRGVAVGEQVILAPDSTIAHGTPVASTATPTSRATEIPPR